MGETMLVCIDRAEPVNSLVAGERIVHLASVRADNLKYGYSNALGYNKCRFGSIPEAALMAKTLIGEKTA